MLLNVETLFSPINRIKEVTRTWPKIRPEILVLLWVLFIWLLSDLLFRSSDTVDLVIMGIVGLPIALLCWFRPEYGVIGLMFFSSGFLSPSFVDIRLPIGGGFEMPDLFLLMMLGLLFAKGLIRKELNIPWWPVGGIFTLFMGFVVFAAVNGFIFESVPSNWAFSDFRILLFYLTFFIVAWSVRSEESLYSVVFGTFIIADMTASIIILQQFVGPNNLLLESMAEGGAWAVYSWGGFVRILPPGIVFLYLMFLISVGYMIFAEKNVKMFLFSLAQSGILGIAILLTFTRSTWAAAGFAIILLAIILIPYYRKYAKKILVYGIASSMFLFGFIGLVFDGQTVQNQFVSSVAERFTSIFTVSETFESNSLIWRRFEFQQGVKSIQENPLIGVGLGNSYRAITTLQGEAEGAWVEGDLSQRRYDRFTRYAHSSYMGIMIKLGVPAMFVFLWFSFAVIVHGFVIYSKLEPGFAKGLALVIGPALLGLLQWSIFHAQLFLIASTPVVGLMAGIMAAIHFIYIDEKNPNRVTQKLKPAAR